MSDAAWRRDWRKRNPEKVREYERRKKAKNPALYAEIRRRAQHKHHGYPEPTRPRPDVCECCGKPPGAKGLALDHDHETGRFRGWLCNCCNLGLGRIGDTLAAAKRLVAYLERSLQ